MSIVIHEFAHGYSAYLLGDNTARDQGRLTLNPLKHLDPFGSVLLPMFLIFMKAGFVIGWARPVPYNPANLRNEKTGTFIVAIAGILANLFVAILFGLLMRYANLFIPIIHLAAFYKIASIIVITNLVLFLFNIIPIPPLDGSKILFSFLPYKYRYIENFLEKWGMFILLFFIIFLWKNASPLIFILFSAITGFSI